MNKSSAHISAGSPASSRYLSPGWFTTHVFNRSVRFLTRRGISLMGSRELRVAGRTSGEIRTTVVNLLDVDGRQYLVAPRGTTQWVRNLRAAGVGELRLGRRVQAFRARELSDDEKPPVLDAYVRRWRWEVGKFFEGLSKEPTPAELAAIAPGFPVFVVLPDDNAVR
jgi:deazaflavin-dependent oxidoreductase (nitroreductase family)